VWGLGSAFLALFTWVLYQWAVTPQDAGVPAYNDLAPTLVCGAVTLAFAVATVILWRRGR
jgi:hypothetical protein